MKKLFFMILIVLLFCSLPLMAFGRNEAISEESWLLEHSSVNNENKYWDVSKVLNPSAPDKNYTAASDNGLLRIRTNYGRNYTADSYRTVTITPVGGSWEFVSDRNATVTRAYTFDLYKIEWTRNSSTGTATASGNPTKINPNTQSPSEYSFVMSKATWTSEWSIFSGTTYYTNRFNDYEIVLRLPELTESESSRLEPGSYHASFDVTLYTGSDGGTAVTQRYTIKAEYGATSGANVEYSFMVEEADDTYNVDLSRTDHCFAVANLAFHAAGLSTSNSNANTITSQNSGRYKVLISPYSRYDMDNTSSENPYMFILNGSDNMERTEINTVWYTLAGSSDGAALSLYDGNRYKHTYVITPTLDVSGDNRNWVLNWDLSQLIYIKPIAPTTAITRANGFYHTTLYFYVVTNT